MADPASCFKYNFALVSRVANSFAESSSYDLLRGERVDIDRARQEHETLVDALRRIGLDVVELPCDEKHPDGLFVDDVAVVINGTALICNPPSIGGRPSRQGEVCHVHVPIDFRLLTFVSDAYICSTYYSCPNLPAPLAFPFPPLGSRPIKYR